jgi:hypothetical protein
MPFAASFTAKLGDLPTRADPLAFVFSLSGISKRKNMFFNPATLYHESFCLLSKMRKILTTDAAYAGGI